MSPVAMFPADLNPLTSEISDEEMLRNLPIVWALARIEFPPIKSVVHDSYIAGFQEAVRQTYPEYAKRVSIGLTITPEGRPSGRELPPVHDFKNAEGRTTISLGENFIAVNSLAYKNRQEFLGSLASIAGAAEKCLKPNRVSRLGVRFICRLTGDDVDKIQSFVRADFVPPMARFLKKGVSGGSQSRAIYQTGEDSTLIAQWGFIPPDAEVTELQGVPPLDENGNRVQSWIMDADCVVLPQSPVAFTEGEVVAGASPMVNRICAFLAWVFSGELV